MNKTIHVGTLFCLSVLAQSLVAGDYTWTPSTALWLTDENWNNGSAWVDNNTALFTGNAPTDVTVTGTAQADDVKVSIRNQVVEMTIIKKFA